jgi:anti-sigma regulatory factor (Ser/Thr protein kinase)
MSATLAARSPRPLRRPPVPSPRGFLEGRLLRLTPEETALRRARESLGWLARYLGGERLEEARLLVSELVTNSCVHAGLEPEHGWILLEAHALPDRVRVAVTDSGPGFRPEPALPPPTAIGGRGLWLVERLSSRWGYGPPGRSRIWFDLPRR